MWTFTYYPSFDKSIRKLDNTIKDQVLDFLELYKDGIDDPMNLPNIKKLSGYSYHYRLRFGKYRVGIELHADTKIIAFRYVGTRGDFYKNFP
jgi:mRNA-degrading endonuclease RelE of RelBE toxin-antitoxin system